MMTVMRIYLYPPYFPSSSPSYFPAGVVTQDGFRLWILACIAKACCGLK